MWKLLQLIVEDEIVCGHVLLSAEGRVGKHTVSYKADEEEAYHCYQEVLGSACSSFSYISDMLMSRKRFLVSPRNHTNCVVMSMRPEHYSVHITDCEENGLLALAKLQCRCSLLTFNEEIYIFIDLFLILQQPCLLLS